MRAGRLRHRLALQSKTSTRDSYGAAVIGWTLVDTVWGAIEPLSGREYFSHEQVQAEAKVRIVIRYRSGVDTTWRVSHGGKFYDVLDVLNENTRNRMLTLMCREGVSEKVGDVASDIPANALYDVDGNPLQDVDGNYIVTVD